MESGDDILPDVGLEMRRSASRDLFFFSELRRLGLAPPGQERESALHKLLMSYDSRRRLVTDDLDPGAPALEAVEFLIRLGAS